MTETTEKKILIGKNDFEDILHNCKNYILKELYKYFRRELRLSNIQKIPKSLRKACWNTFIGVDIGKSKCKCCNIIDITQHGFICAYIIPVSKGGPLCLENLRPICDKCNLDMNSQDMNEFALKHYGVDLCQFPNISDDNGK